MSMIRIINKCFIYPYKSICKAPVGYKVFENLAFIMGLAFQNFMDVNSKTVNTKPKFTANIKG